MKLEKFKAFARGILLPIEPTKEQKRAAKVMQQRREEIWNPNGSEEQNTASMLSRDGNMFNYDL